MSNDRSEELDGSEVSHEDTASNTWFRFVPAAVLAIAACMKAHQLATSPYVGNLPFGSRELALLTVAMEVFLAIWLVSNWKPKAARFVTLGVFFVFLGSLTFKILNGEDSCGCFGVLEVPPIFTTVIDVLMLVLLFLWKPGVDSGKFPLLLSTVGVAVMALFTIASLQVKTVPLTEIGTVVGGNEFVIIEPDTWIGKPFPMSQLIDGPKPYLQKKWAVVLYHEDCPKCQALLEAPGSIWEGNPVAFVEAPPYLSPQRTDSTQVVYRKLTDQHNWFVEAPEIIRLEEGVVVGTD